MFEFDIFRVFGWLAGGLSALCYVPYIRGILKKEVRPERASWLIWSVLTAMGFFSNLAIGATHSLWLPGVQGMGVIIVFFAFNKKWVWKFIEERCRYSYRIWFDARDLVLH